jgi:hypothetical protein
MPVLKTYKNGVWVEVDGVSGHTHTKNDITDFPSSLPANGGNADTLDGKHASEFATVSDVERLQTQVDNIQENAYDDTELRGLISTNASDIVDLQTVLDTKQNSLVFNTAYNASTNKVATMSDVDAVEKLVGEKSVATQIDEAVGTLEAAIAGKSDSGHTHDDRYYTESEVDSKLSGKANADHTHDISNVSGLQTTLDTINSEVDGSIKELSVSGKTITYTKNDGSTGTITTQDTNTDTKVTQTVSTTDGSFPVLLRGTSAGTTTTTTTTTFASGITANPSEESITATTFKGDLSGNATTATSATKATQDGSGNTITSTYETKTAAATKLEEAKTYTDTAISNLINGAPTTLDTLGEIATAMENNADVVDALEDAIGTKAKASDLTAHTGNKSNPHGVTLAQLGVTATATELNYIDGATSNIQTQITTLSNLVGTEKVSEQISAAIAGKAQVQIHIWGADD